MTEPAADERPEPSPITPETPPVVPTDAVAAPVDDVIAESSVTEPVPLPVTSMEPVTEDSSPVPSLSEPLGEARLESSAIDPEPTWVASIEAAAEPTFIPVVPLAPPSQPVSRSKPLTMSFWLGLAVDVLLIALILVGVYFRFSWTNWNQGTDLHPDEYGLTSTLTRLSIPETLGDYFNTRLSSLSPYQKYDINGLPTEGGADNRMRWGQWPITIVRLASELTGNTGYTEMRLFGRQLSAFADVLALLFTYLIGWRLYSHRVGLMGAALSALAVMQIQQSHFLTSDNFGVLFTVMTMYCAVEIVVRARGEGSKFGPEWLWYALFGVFCGMTVASRINLAPLAGLVAVAAFIGNSHLIMHERDDAKFSGGLRRVIGLLVLSGICCIISFRVTQPMSFRAETGDTTLFTLKPNQEWLESLQVAQSESSGIGGGPPGEQWTNRPAIIFPLTNMVIWGMGLPLGIAAWAGFALALLYLFRGKDWYTHLLLVTWVGGYFFYMGTRWVKSMRYFLPIYPFLALFAAWLIVEIWNRGRRYREDSLQREPSSGLSISYLSIASVVLGAIVLFGTLAWAYGFTSIYRNDNTRIQATRWIFNNVPAPLGLRIETADGLVTEPLPFSNAMQVTADAPVPVSFISHFSGSVKEITVGYARNTFDVKSPIAIRVVLATDPSGLQPIAQADIRVTPSGDDIRGDPGTGKLGPVDLVKDQTYYLLISSPEGGPVNISGSFISGEDWDETVPLRMNGYDPFGGLYVGPTMHVRAADDENKRLMFTTVLEQADYITMASQRAIWSASRLPASYPMTMEYYRALFDGRLGFDLVHTETSPFVIGPLRVSDVGGSFAWNENPSLPLFNDNMFSAEEAFSVYDHAPVWIFKKRADFDINKAAAVLNAIDLTRVINMGPREATAAPTLLMLPEDRLAEQQAGGTWADMFNREWILNKFQPLGVVVWWVTCVLLGWLAFPLVFVGMHGLSDRGYALARNFGMLFVAWVAWLLGSFRIMPFTQLTLWLVTLFMAVLSGLVLWRRYYEIVAWLKHNKRYILIVEALSLAFFVFFLLIRWGNGDLWHGSYGGEKPMDFSYFNAVLKSTSFPPYDPWYSGGYLNYYYFGFVVVGVLTKMLGIVPAFAYNLILPMLFSMAGIGAFCVAYNLVAGGRKFASEELPTKLSLQRLVANPYAAGILAACLFVALGNLGEWNTVMTALTRTASDIQPATPIGFINDWQKAAVGLWRIYVEHYPVPVGTGEWYWNATRVIQDQQTPPISEFPFFTFLYADLHAHMIVLTTTTLALGWCLSYVLAATEKRRWLETIASFGLAGLAFGAIQPSNLSDYQTFWVLGCITVAYAELRRHREINMTFAKHTAFWCAVLIGLAVVFFYPYSTWRGEGYGSVEAWQGDKTPISAYWTIHGLFLFIIVFFLFSETRRWMQRTNFDDIKAFIGPSLLGLAAFVLMLLGAWYLGYPVAIIAMPLILWTGLLMIQKEAEPERRAVLALIGLGLALTMLVEAVVAKGDIGRMNTVFKFYLQVWTFFSIAAGAAVAWLWAQMPEWRSFSRNLLQIGLTILITVAAMYTVLAASAKVQDRMAVSAPRTLDGMQYMEYAQYADNGQTFDLKDDYDAIIWMQENVKGSPVIVEMHVSEYKWGNRFTINTGLPGVLGWRNHQAQQRNLVPDSLIWNRQNDIEAFYQTFAEADALTFIQTYDVKYIIAGAYEHVFYPPPSFEKFDRMVEAGVLRVAYDNDQTKIYEVIK